MKKNMKKGFLIALFMLLLALPMCAQAASKPTKVKFTKKTYYVPVGKSFNLAKKLKIYPAGAKTKLKWTSKKKNIATVSKKGVVKAKKKVGKTTIIVKTKNRITAKCTIYVVKPVKTITAKKTSATVKMGESFKINVSVAPKSATVKDLVYESSNTAVATVSGDGIVTARGNGTATITATSVQSGKSVSCTVTVNGSRGSLVNDNENDADTDDEDGSTSGSTPTPTKPTVVRGTAKLVYNANPGANSNITEDFYSGYNKTNWITSDTTTFTVNSIVPTDVQYKFKGWSTSKNGTVQYQPGASITVKKGDTVTLYAQWEHKTFKKKEIKLLAGIPDSGYSTGSKKYYKNADGSGQDVRGYTYVTINGEDYLLNSIFEGEASYSFISGINLTKLTKEIASAIGESQFTISNLVTLEHMIQSFYISDDGVLYTDRITQYGNSKELVNAEFTAGKCKTVYINGHPLTQTQLATAYSIWAKTVDSWCDKDGMGYWDFMLYGNRHFKYHLLVDWKGIADGVEHTSYHTGYPIICGEVTVYEMED